MKKTKIRWLDAPQKHDYPAAESYLRLILRPREAKSLVRRLKRAGIAEFAAKDIFRASDVPMLGSSDSHVERYRSSILLKEALSPLLLCRDPAHGKLVITGFARFMRSMRTR
jgi:hypothetical protein